MNSKPLTLYYTSFLVCLFLGIFSSVAQSSQSINNSIAKLQEVKEIIESDSIAAFEKLKEVELSEIPLNDSSFMKIAFDKLNLLGDYYAEKYFQQELNTLFTYLKKEEAQVKIARIHNYLSQHYLDEYSLDSSLYHINQAIAIYHDENLEAEVGELLLTKAVIFYSLDEYIQSIETVFDAIDKFKDSDQEKQIAFSYLQIGSTYLYINYLDEAEKYYQMASTHFIQMGDSLGAAICNSNLALIQFEKGNYESTISMLHEAIPQIVKSNRQILIAYAYQSLGEAFLELQQNDSALKYIQQSFVLNKELDYQFGKTKDYYLLARNKQQQNELDSALYFAQLSLQLLEEEADNEIDLALSTLLAELYEEDGQIKKSNEFLNRKIAVMNEMEVEKDYISRLSQTENQKLKETEYALKIAQEKEKQSIERQKLQGNIIFLLTVLLTLIFSGLIFFIITNKNNKLLNQQLSDELERNQSLIEEIHHRVKNNLQVISSMLSLQSMHMKEKKLREVLNECRNRINSMALIHESLYKKEDNITPSFDIYVHNLIPLLIETYQIDKSKIQLQMEVEEIMLPLEQSIPCGLIINELISNSLKHAFEGKKEGTIKVEMKSAKGWVDLNVSDNGTGLPKEFDIDEQDTFGFLLIQTMASQLETELELESYKGLTVSLRWKLPGNNKLRAVFKST